MAHLTHAALTDNPPQGSGSPAYVILKLQINVKFKKKKKKLSRGHNNQFDVSFTLFIGKKTTLYRIIKIFLRGLMFEKKKNRNIFVRNVC